MRMQTQDGKKAASVAKAETKKDGSLRVTLTAPHEFQVGDVVAILEASWLTPAKDDTP